MQIQRNKFPWARVSLLVLLKGVRPFSGKDCRHAFHYPPEPQGPPLRGQLGILHPIDQPMKHHEHAVIVLCGRHLIEVAVCFESQQPALFTQHRPTVVQVPLVANYHYRSFVRVQVVFGRLNSLNEPADCVEAGSVTDAVDKNVAVRPLNLLLKEGCLLRQILSKQMSKLYLQQ